MKLPQVSTSNKPSSSKTDEISSHCTQKNVKEKHETKEKPKTTAEMQINEHRQEMQVFL